MSDTRMASSLCRVRPARECGAEWEYHIYPIRCLRFAAGLGVLPSRPRPGLGKRMELVAEGPVDGDARQVARVHYKYVWCSRIS